MKTKKVMKKSELNQKLVQSRTGIFAFTTDGVGIELKPIAENKGYNYAGYGIDSTNDGKQLVDRFYHSTFEKTFFYVTNMSNLESYGSKLIKILKTRTLNNSIVLLTGLSENQASMLEDLGIEVYELNKKE